MRARRARRVQRVRGRCPLCQRTKLREQRLCVPCELTILLDFVRTADATPAGKAEWALKAWQHVRERLTK